MRRQLIPFAALALLALIAADRVGPCGGPGDGGAPAGQADAGRVDAGRVDAGVGDALLADAFAERRSDLWVTGAGTVERELADDTRGSRHQRFILRLASGQTLLVSHNIDLAPRVPLARGDRVEFRGEYEWNERGGVLHWTHHDPDLLSGGRRHPERGEGGWLRHRGQLYR